MDFESWQDYQTYATTVKNNRRYIFNDQVDNFLKVVSHTSQDRLKYLEEGTTLWRAQKGFNLKAYKINIDEEIDFECPYPPDRMKPLHYRATEGRANPKGIPFLYLSDCKKTAMSEVRPWLGAVLSLGIFKVIKRLSIIDCSMSISGSKEIFLENPSPEIREKAVWRDINEAFSKPVQNNEDRSEYVPTQILAELFRDIGFDGIAYKSLLGEGLNIVLFNLDDVNVEKAFLHKVKSLKFEFDEHSSPFNSVTYKS
jgi:hypothetical protein